MRKVISLTLATAMFASGLYLLYLHIFVSSFSAGELVLVGVFLTIVGGMWLWDDLVGPMLGNEDTD